MNATMTPDERAQAIEAAVADIEAQGVRATNEAIHDATGIGWNTIKKHMKARRAEEFVGTPPVALAPVVVAPVPPVPRPAPVAPLLAKKQRCAEYDQDWRDHQREGQQLAQDRGECWSDYRHTLHEAQRLAPRYRTAYQATQLGLYREDVGMQQEAARLHQALSTLVGEADTLQVASGGTPWWLTAER